MLTERELAAWRGMLATHRDVVARLDAELERDHGLPLSSYEVLMYLADAPTAGCAWASSPTGLLLSRSGLTRLVDRLERQGMVERERCEDDARGYFAAAHPARPREARRARPRTWPASAGTSSTASRPTRSTPWERSGRRLLGEDETRQAWTKRRRLRAATLAANDYRINRPGTDHNRPRARSPS